MGFAVFQLLFLDQFKKVGSLLILTVGRTVGDTGSGVPKLVSIPGERSIAFFADACVGIMETEVASICGELRASASVVLPKTKRST